MPDGHVTSVGQSYDAARLRVGILGIGTVLVALWVGAPTGATDAVAGALTPAPRIVAGAVSALLLGIVASVLLLPLDVAGGVLIERRLRPVRLSGWARSYAIGVVGWLAMLAVGGALIGASLSAGRLWWLVASVLAALGIVIAHRLVDLASTTELEELAPSELAMLGPKLEALGLVAPKLAWAPGEPTLSGGFVGDTLALSAGCRALSGTDELACLVAREIGHRQLHHQRTGIIVASLWAALAPPLAVLVVAPDRSSAASVVAAVAFASSTWAWIGLLVLPSLGRRQVLAADRFVVERGVDPLLVRATLELLAQRNHVDRARSALVERIFHPVPSLERRLEALP